MDNRTPTVILSEVEGSHHRRRHPEALALKDLTISAGKEVSHG